MKKTTIILLLVLQIILLFIFQNLHSLFRSIESIDITQIRDQNKFMEDIQKLRKMFSGLTMVLAFMVIGTGIYLVVLFRKPKPKIEPDAESISPLQDYLMQLKGSEIRLKDLVEKHQEHAVQKEELSKSIINNINSAVIFLDQAGRIGIFNPVAERIFNQSYANAKNNFPEIIFSTFPEIVSFVKTHRKTGTKASVEIDSRDRTFFIDSNPIENIGQLLLIKDITDKKKREEIGRRNSNFIMLGEMAAFLAHEIRNSLGVVYGYTNTLQGDPDKTAKINKEINFLSTMMESFLNFAKPVKIDQKETVDIAKLIEQIAAEKGIDVKLNRDTLIFESDSTLVRSIFSNLLLNSGEANANRVEVAFSEAGSAGLEILFKDNGTGIDEKVKDKIWYPFFTTKDKGTGMGLAMIRKIINTLNGEISLFSTDTQGTTFKIIFYR